MVTKRSVLSLFSGCGGLDLGFVRAGFQIEAAYDNWEPAVSTYRANSRLLTGPIYQRSLSLEDGEISLPDLPRCEVVLGGPPCQGFSFAGKQFIDDPRNKLYRDFVEIVRFIGPRVFLMENVRGMQAMVLDQVKHDFAAAGYDVTVDLAKATEFGIPQRRERLMIVGFRKDLKVRFFRPAQMYGPLWGSTDRVSILDAIGDLPHPLQLTNQGQLDVEDLALHLQSHVYRPLPPDVQAFVKHIPNGGCFRDAPRSTLPRRLQVILDNPSRYRSPRLFPKPDPFGPAQTVPADTNPSLGGVLAPDFCYCGGHAQPVAIDRFSIDGLYTAPEPSRRFTPREAARLQTFPDEFVLRGSVSAQYRQIGNAVPVLLAQEFADGIMRHLVQADADGRPLVRED